MKSRVSRPRIYGLEDFGLDLRKLRELGSVAVQLSAHVRYPDEKKLFRFSPAERADRIRKNCEKWARQVLERWPSSDVRALRSRRRWYGLAGTVEARHVSKLLQLEQLADIWIEKIGRRKRPRARRNELRWFAVRALFAIQVEGQMSGSQDYEERIVLVKARDFDDAVRRLQKDFRAYAAPYLNSSGEMVRWSFEELIDVYDV